ncbi:MAG: VWA domain-containing protein [Hyphomicrobiales bacterium]|nr:VWA domain-containing protein [Hyphomicrobiales bacterium]
MTAGRIEANIVAAQADGGRIAENILYFGRMLRAAGLPVGPRQTVLATEAVLAAGVEDVKTLFWTLHAVFVSKRSEADIFNQAFHLFWRDPGYVQQLMSVMVPSLKREPRTQDAMARRLAESLMSRKAAEAAPERDELRFEATGTFSGAEVLQSKDFEQMSAEELRLAREAVKHMGLAMAEMRTRRFAPASRGERLNVRAMLKAMGAHGPDALRPMWRARAWRRPPLVALCDISGSMDAYARVFLHFLYTVANDRERVSAFLFGTRLTNISRALRNRDPDAAIAKASRAAPDWAGGTRIGESLSEFNRLWARRVLGQNATVLLITDGLDRSGGEGVAAAARRLRASSRRLIWLNPLLRYDEYAPLAAGARELTKHVSETRPCHNLRSMADLVAALR